MTGQYNKLLSILLFFIIWPFYALTPVALAFWNNQLIDAAKADNLRTVQEALLRGADINGSNRLGENALYMAAENGHLAMVEYLVSQGAGSSGFDRENMLPLCGAAQNGYLAVVKYLADQFTYTHREYEEALSSAAWGGHRLVIEYLVNQGADIHANNEKALRNAVKNKQFAVVRYLIQRGADRSVLDAYQLQQFDAYLYELLQKAIKEKDIEGILELLNDSKNPIILTQKEQAVVDKIIKKLARFHFMQPITGKRFHQQTLPIDNLY